MIDQPEVQLPIIIQHQDPNPPLDHEFTRADFPSVEEVITTIEKDSYLANARAKPDNVQMSEEQIRNFTQQTLEEMFMLELAARSPNIWHITPELARQISLVVDFSAPGTYYKPVKDDRWKEEPFAWGLDRTRADVAARLGIYLAGLKTGQDLSAFCQMDILDGLNPTLQALQNTAKNSISTSGLQFYYVGRPDEGNDILKVINTPSSFVPKENVTVINTPDVNNTVDQVEKLGEFLRSRSSNNNLVIVSQVPQIPRIMSIIDAKKIVTEDVGVYVFPIPTPTLGLKDYPTVEVRRKLYTHLTHNASPTSHPYQLLGK